VRGDGAKLVGRGSLEWQNERLTLNVAGNDRYKGKVKAKIQGTKTTINYSWRVLSPERMVGTATAKVKARGVNCTITRQLKATYEGPA
jgi:hypothetical protein